MGAGALNVRWLRRWCLIVGGLLVSDSLGGLFYMYVAWVSTKESGYRSCIARHGRFAGYQVSDTSAARFRLP